VDWELSLDAPSGHNAANSEHLASALPTAADDGTGENLSSTFLPFVNEAVHINGVTNVKRRSF
jgi:hypothetical protein